MTDGDASPEPAEPRGTPPGPDKMSAWVCTLWLLNAVTGAAMAIREDFAGATVVIALADDLVDPVKPQVYSSCSS